MFDQWSQTQKLSFSPLLELNSITTRLCGKLLQQNLKAMNSLAQSGQEQLQTLSGVKGVNEALQCQSQWIADTVPQAFDHAEKLLNTVLDSATEYRDWFEGNMETMKRQSQAMSEKVRHQTERE